MGARLTRLLREALRVTANSLVCMYDDADGSIHAELKPSAVKQIEASNISAIC